MKPRLEYIFEDLPEHLRLHYFTLTRFVPGGNVGFDLDGVRYRVYRDEAARSGAGDFCDVLDASKGCDVPLDRLEEAFRNLGITAKDPNRVKNFLRSYAAGRCVCGCGSPIGECSQ